MKVRASTTALVHPSPIQLASACSVMALPRNDTLFVLTNDGVLTRWHLDGDARAVSSLEIGPGRSIHATSRSNTGIVETPSSEIVVFDLDSPAFARFAGPAGERRAWLPRSVAVLGDDGRITIYAADGGTKTLDPHIAVGPWMAIDATLDGRSLVIGDAKGDLTLFAIEDGATRRWHAHDAAILGVICTPDGREVLTAGRDGRLRVWEIASGMRRGEQVVAEQDRDPTLSSVQIAADGTVARVTTHETHTTHTPWGELEESSVFTTAYYATTPDLTRIAIGGLTDVISPDGRWLVARGWQESSLRDLHAKDRPEVGTAPGPARFADLIVGGPIPYALVSSGTRIARWCFAPTDSSRPNTECTELRFLSPSVLVSAHKDSDPCLRDAATAAPLGFFGHSSWKLTDLYLAASGRHVVHSQYGAQLMHLRHAVIELGEPPRLVREVPDQTVDTGRHAALGSERFVVVGRNGAQPPLLEVRDVVTDGVILQTAGPGFYDHAWIVSDDPLRLAITRSAHRDQPMELWDVATNTAMTKIEGPSRGARRLCIHRARVLSYTPPVLQSMGPTNALVLWCFRSSSSHVLEGHESPPSCATFVSEQRALSADASAVFAWDLEARALLWKSPLPAGVDPPERLVPIGAKYMLIPCGLFGPHLVLRTSDGSCIHTVRGSHVAPLGDRVGIIQNGELVIIDVETGEPVARWRGAMDATAWTPLDPNTIAVGDACGDITVLDV